MTLQAVRLSIGRTWRFVTAESACVDDDLSAYRNRVDALKSGEVSADYELPWPPYRSRFWAYMFNPSYRETRSATQVAALLPLRWQGSLPAAAGANGYRTPVEVEAVRHPFALTALAHLELTIPEPWPTDAEASAVLRSMLRSSLTGTSQVQDGVPLNVLPALPTTEFQGRPARFEDVGNFVVLSGLEDGSDAKTLASSLALRFDDAPDPDKAHPLRTRAGAICVSGNTVGLVLPSTLPRAEQRSLCLHHNVTLLLTYLQNLATLTPSAPTVSCEWFRGRAAAVLNHLYRRTPMPQTGSVYKSRLTELWLTERGVTAAVNALTPELPQLPVAG